MCLKDKRTASEMDKCPDKILLYVRGLSDVTAGVDIPNNKNQPTAHASDLASDKFWIFPLL